MKQFPNPEQSLNELREGKQDMPREVGELRTDARPFSTVWYRNDDDDDNANGLYMLVPQREGGYRWQRIVDE